MANPSTQTIGKSSSSDLHYRTTTTDPPLINKTVKVLKAELLSRGPSSMTSKGGNSFVKLSIVANDANNLKITDNVRCQFKGYNSTTLIGDPGIADEENLD